MTAAELRPWFEALIGADTPRPERDAVEKYRQKRSEPAR